MTAEGGAATQLDGRHNLQLAEAQVATLVLTQGRPVGAEDIRNLQAWHERALLGSGRLQRTEYLAQGVGGHLGIQRGGLELFMSEQDLDSADIFALLEQMSCKRVTQGMHRDALIDVRGLRSLVHRAVQLSGAQRIHRIEAREQITAG